MWLKTGLLGRKEEEPFLRRLAEEALTRLARAVGSRAGREVIAEAALSLV